MTQTFRTYALAGLLAAAFAGISLFVAPDKACASGIAPQTCDTEVWRTMDMRARMETEREIMQNQNLIFKPDSVLAYTCFDKFAEHAAQYAGQLFTHTNYWGELIIQWGDPNGMDHAIKKVVLESMKTYMSSNYPDSLLGGRGQHLGGGDLGPYSTSQTGKGDYACGVMNAVWKAAKCMNFIHSTEFEDTDGFYPYIDLKAHDGGEDIAGYETIKDTRQFPTACNSVNPILGKDWKTAFRESRNENDFGNMSKFYEFSAPLQTTFTEVRHRIGPPEQKCADPIMTGVLVIDTGEKPYEDGICTNPGCHFKKGDSKGTCEKS